MGLILHPNLLNYNGMTHKAMYLASPNLGQITKFNPKMQVFKHVIFFNWLLNLQNFVFSNGSENVQNVIQMALK